MGQYSAKFDAHIERIAKVVYGSMYSKRWKALVLLGGDGTPQINTQGEERPFNGYDFLVVTRSIDPLIKRSLRKMEVLLSEELDSRVVLHPCFERLLKKGSSRYPITN